MGLFWHEEVKPSKQKARIPEPTWLEPDYLPGLAKAREFDVPLIDDDELVDLLGTQLICDIEVYPNYFLCAFLSVETGKSFYVEFEEEKFIHSDALKLEWVMRNFQIITFNGINFDLPIIALALDGKTTGELKHATDMLIQMDIKPWEMLKAFKIEPLEIDHIDLIEVCPLQASLKIYGGRLNAPKMADLPFPPNSRLSKDQIDIIRFYCINDLNTTAIILENLKEQLSIRKEMSAKYGIDLRSKSDAQVAEAVIKSELRGKFERPKIPAGTSYKYKIPFFLNFQTDVLKSALKRIQKANFVVGESGAVSMPKELEGFTIPLGNSVYKMGIGGLHSTETNISHQANEQFKIVDKDVASYYPAIILNQGLYPNHLGPRFLDVYRSLVSRRLKAKKEGDKVTADMLKIVINGSFGKFGSKWSALYSPDLLIQVTITGQLSLLMLIEALELSGISVVSANTDGVVMRYPRIMQEVVDSITSDWEIQTNFETEETEYSAIYSKDVNNYLAIKPDGKTKGKGAYSIGEGIFRFHKNPTNIICVEAAIKYLTEDIPVRTTIEESRDLTKFLTVRTVKGGAVKNGVFLGKAIRWYYSKGAGGEIVYAASGNKVPKSDGAEPCMEIPDEFPDDIDYGRYINETYQILRDISA